MDSNLNEEINAYWSKRARGYSLVNQEELNGCQRQNWFQVIDEQISKTYPERKRDTIKVLDIGTGPGFLAIILAEQGYQVTAIDSTAQMLTEAKHNAAASSVTIPFLQMDAQALCFPVASFDVVISRNLTWVLERPERAYQSWLKVLKPKGLLLNFDANWYGYLFDEQKRQLYEVDRANVKKMDLDDHYTGTDIEGMERIALKVPLSSKTRPQWDVEVLEKMPVKQITFDLNIGNQVLSETEKINYASTPLFMVQAIKG